MYFVVQMFIDNIIKNEIDKKYDKQKLFAF